MSLLSKKLIICVLILCAVLMLYGGCGKDKKNDIKAKDNIKDVNICNQCAAMTPEACKQSNYCVQKCICGDGSGTDDKTVCRKVLYNGTTVTYCSNNINVTDGKTCTVDDDCEHSQTCETINETELNETINNSGNETIPDEISICVSFGCPENQTQHKHTCVPVVEVIGIVCVKNEECLGNQTCIPHPDVINQTVCKGLSCPGGGQIPLNHTCVTTLEMPCSTHTECAAGEKCTESPGNDGGNFTNAGKPGKRCVRIP